MKKTPKTATKTVSTPVAVENTDTKPLTNAVDKLALDKLEAAFKAALREPAAIIAEIRARKLYEPKFASFTDYAAKRLKIQVPVVWNAVWAEAQKLNGNGDNKSAAKPAKPAVKKAAQPAKKAATPKVEEAIAEV